MIRGSLGPPRRHVGLESRDQMLERASSTPCALSSPCAARGRCPRGNNGRDRAARWYATARRVMADRHLTTSSMRVAARQRRSSRPTTRQTRGCPRRRRRGSKPACRVLTPGKVRARQTLQLVRDRSWSETAAGQRPQLARDRSWPVSSSPPSGNPRMSQCLHCLQSLHPCSDPPHPAIPSALTIPWAALRGSKAPRVWATLLRGSSDPPCFPRCQRHRRALMTVQT
jgi:hypothetical protein